MTLTQLVVLSCNAISVKAHISSLLTIESPVAQWLERPARSRVRVRGVVYLELGFFYDLM